MTVTPRTSFRNWFSPSKQRHFLPTATAGLKCLTHARAIVVTAAVYDNGVIHMRQLEVAADDGAIVEVRIGLQSADQLILNLPIGATDGMCATTIPELIS
jgi:hypothetical protein